ncbi:hypothetical protein KJA15_03480 [Patescibacteria group bacterium]|nr:hypothetical protein [Patescibacteria group bacterium]
MTIIGICDSLILEVKHCMRIFTWSERQIFVKWLKVWLSLIACMVTIEYFVFSCPNEKIGAILIFTVIPSVTIALLGSFTVAKLWEDLCTKGSIITILVAVALFGLFTFITGVIFGTNIYPLS